MHILHVVGARPNFMKAAPVLSALAQRGVTQTLVHTGQHYDTAMSKVFFDELGLPEPDINLQVGSASHSRQLAEVMIRIEPVLLERKPDWVLVYGDINSTLAAALVSAKLQIPVGHVEAGLRSFDRTMPEEINRILTDQLSQVLFTPSPDGNANLLKEGISSDKVHLVGNVMIDTLVRLLPCAEERWQGLRARLADSLDLSNGYCVVTLHRPSNVDDPAELSRIVAALQQIAQRIPIVFPVHPRTRGRLPELNTDQARTRLLLTEPLGYLDFLALQRHARVIVTDSGGIQEETTYLGVPCLTMRDNTERPVTVTHGTNILIGRDASRLGEHVNAILERQPDQRVPPELWDGRASGRIARILA